MRSSFSLNVQSVQDIIGKTSQVVVYGYHDCLYTFVCTNLSEQGYEAYNFIDGVGPLREELHNSDMIGHSPHGLFSGTPAQFKGLLANLILLNYKRVQRGMPIVPLLFCVESNIYGEWKMDVIRMMNDESSITAKELRRCYKIYAELTDTFQRIAEDTFKFVRVQKVQGAVQHILVSLPPFWLHPDWESKWKERLQVKNQLPERPKSDWRHTLLWKSYLFEEESAPRFMSCALL